MRLFRHFLSTARRFAFPGLRAFALASLLTLTLPNQSFAQAAADDEEEAEEKAPPEDPMIRAARTGKVSVAKVIQRLRALETAKGDQVQLRSELLAAACLRATPAEMRELEALLLKLPEPERFSGRHDPSLHAFVSALFRAEVEKLKKNPRKLTLPETTDPVPESLQKAPQEFRDAWKAWRAVIAPRGKLKKAIDDHEASLAGQTRPEISALLRKFIAAPKDGLWKDFYISTGGAFQEFKQARNRAAALALLHEGKIEDALALACSQAVGPYFDDWHALQTYAETLTDLLTAVGLDWELVFLGALLDKPAADEEDFVRRENEYWRTTAWDALGALGSERGVRLALAWMKEARLDAADTLSFIRSAAGPPPKSFLARFKPDPRGLLDLDADRTKPLPDKIRGELFAYAAARLDPALPLESLNDMLVRFPEWLAKDLREPLEKLLKHPNHYLASLALRYLADAGLADPKTTVIAPPPPPVRAKLLVNGKPLAKAKLKDGGGEIETDADGRVVYPMDEELEPEKLDDLKFEYFDSPDAPAAKAGKPPKGKQRPAAKPERDPKLWKGTLVTFAIHVADAMKREVEVNIETGELEIGLQATPGLLKGAEATVQVAPEQKNEAEKPTTIMTAKGVPGESVNFEGLQPGNYTVTVEGPGFVPINKLPVRVTKIGSTKLIKLEASRAIDGTVTMLGQDPASLGDLLGSFAELTKDGNPAQILVYSGKRNQASLALGKYRLRVPGLAELIERAKALGGEDPKVPPAENFGPLEIDFELTADSPAVVDLGTFEMKPNGKPAERVTPKPGKTPKGKK